jgi:RNA polymerase sigma-70 factor (ECF subfamily)
MERDRHQWVADLQSSALSVQEEAWGDLLEYACCVAFKCLSKFGNVAESEIWQLAEDAAQEALADIWSKLSSFRGESKFTTWVHPFVRYNVLELLRKRRPSSWPSLDDETVMLLEIISDSATDSPDTEAEEDDLLCTAQEVINAQLTRRQRAVLLLHLVGHTPREIAERVGTTRNNVDQLLHIARKRLRTELVNRGYNIDHE